MIPILTDADDGRDLYFIKVKDFYNDGSFSFTVTRVMERNEDGAPVEILTFASGFAYPDGLLSLIDICPPVMRAERWEWEEQAAAISAIYDFAEKTFNERRKALQVSDDKFNRLT
jgi:hypothetical protein